MTWGFNTGPFLLGCCLRCAPTVVLSVVVLQWSMTPNLLLRVSWGIPNSKFQIQTYFSDSEKRSMCVWEKENQVRLEPFGNFKKLYLLCHICCFMLQMLWFQTNTIHEKIKKNLFIRFHSCKECSGEERKMWNLLGHITETIIDKNDIEKATVSLTLQSSTLSDGDARF